MISYLYYVYILIFKYTYTILYYIMVIYNQSAIQLYPQPTSQMENDTKICKGWARPGGISAVSQSSIFKYLDSLVDMRVGQSIKLVPCVQKFKDLIYSNPVLKMNFEYGIKHSHKTLKHRCQTGEDVLHLVNMAVTSPPCYTNSDLVGFPINAIFVEFMQSENGRNFFSHGRVNEVLKEILNYYGEMLDSPKSLKHMNQTSPNGWFSKQAKQSIDYSLYKCNPTEPHYGFKSWNQWFLRDFVSIARPVGSGMPTGGKVSNMIMNACESTPIYPPMQPHFNTKISDQFWLKDDKYSLIDMFGAGGGGCSKRKKYPTLFEGGTVYQAFLNALSYHRWNAPVDGKIQDIYSIPGTYYLDQSQFICYDASSPNNSQSFLSSVAARQVFIIKADNHLIGHIAIIFIGMAEVSSCVPTVQIGDKITTGQQIGHFSYGGSSHCMIFQKKAKLKFSQDLYKKDCNGEHIGQMQVVNSFLAVLAE